MKGDYTSKLILKYHPSILLPWISIILLIAPKSNAYIIKQLAKIVISYCSPKVEIPTFF
jgi:hypothetical protein